MFIDFNQLSRSTQTWFITFTNSFANLLHQDKSHAKFQEEQSEYRILKLKPRVPIVNKREQLGCAKKDFTGKPRDKCRSTTTVRSRIYHG